MEAHRHEPPAEASEAPDDVSEVEALLRSDDENRRMRGVLALEAAKTIPPEAVELLRKACHDPSREVRTAAHDALRRHGLDLESQDQARVKVSRIESRGAAFLAMISVGSAGTGFLATGLSFLSYYTQGRFPFPSPLSVLFWMNAILTVPFLVTAVLVLLPGKEVRYIAGGVAILSLVGSLVAMLFMRDIFMSQWSYQFAVERQEAYVAFLSPFRVGFMLLPVILGQSMMLFYVTSQRLASAPAGGAAVPVDATPSAD